MYTYAFIESARVEQYNSNKKLNSNFSSHTWNEEDDDSGQQLENRGWKSISVSIRTCQKRAEILHCILGKIVNVENLSKNSYSLLGKICRAISL